MNLRDLWGERECFKLHQQKKNPLQQNIIFIISLNSGWFDIKFYAIKTLVLLQSKKFECQDSNKNELILQILVLS